MLEEAEVEAEARQRQAEEEEVPLVSSLRPFLPSFLRPLVRRRRICRLFFLMQSQYDFKSCE